MKLEIEINAEDIKKLILENEYFRDEIAIKVARDLKDARFDEIKSEYLRIFGEEIKKIVKDYVENYYAGQGIKKQVKGAIESFTKGEVIELLKGKSN